MNRRLIGRAHLADFHLLQFFPPREGAVDSIHNPLHFLAVNIGIEPAIIPMPE